MPVTPPPSSDMPHLLQSNARHHFQVCCCQHLLSASCHVTRHLAPLRQHSLQYSQAVQPSSTAKQYSQAVQPSKQYSDMMFASSHASCSHTCISGCSGKTKCQMVAGLDVNTLLCMSPPPPSRHTPSVWRKWPSNVMPPAPPPTTHSRKYSLLSTHLVHQPPPPPPLHHYTDYTTTTTIHPPGPPAAGSIQDNTGPEMSQPLAPFPPSPLQNTPEGTLSLSAQTHDHTITRSHNHS
jgi:hypothetical protein